MSDIDPEKLEAGAIFIVAHPFCWEMASKPGDDPEGPISIEFMSWRPGTRGAFVYPDDGEEVADGMGAQVLRIVSVHKPPGYPMRVFYTRRWRDPRGHEFGKGGLRIKVASAFRRLVRGYRHEFRVLDGAEFVARCNELKRVA